MSLSSLTLQQDVSTVTIEGREMKGLQAIQTEYNEFLKRFQNLKHNIGTLDAQITAGNGIFIFVTGSLIVCALL
jgi:hypothetical protein